MSKNPYLKNHPGQGSPYGAYRKTGGLAQLIVVLLGLFALCQSGLIYASLAELESLSQYRSNKKFLEHFKPSELGLFWDHCSLILSFLLAGLWCIWTSRVCKNAWLINSKDGALAIYRGRKSYHPASSWTSYLIPIANLWLPLKAMAWIRDASQKSIGLTMGRLVGFWWFFWILSTVTSAIAAYSYVMATGKQGVIVSHRLTLTLSPVTFLSILFAGLLVLRLSKIQLIRARELNLSTH